MWILLAGVETCFWWQRKVSDGSQVQHTESMCRHMSARTRLFKFSEDVALKTLYYTFSQYCEQQTLRPFGPLPAGCIHCLQYSYKTSREPQSHDMRQMVTVTSLAGNTIIASHIHIKASTNTWVQTGVWTDFIGLDVRCADVNIIQAEGEAAAGVRLRLRAVPPTPAGHVSWRCEDPQSAGRSCWRHAGARGRVGEGVGGGRGGGRGGGWGERRQGGHGAEHAVFILCVQDGGLTRWDGHPGLPAWGHRAGLNQGRSALVTLLTSRRWGGVVTSIERGRTFK